MNRTGAGKGAPWFLESRKLLTEKHGRVTFDDVAASTKAKEELEEIVEFLRSPQKFNRLGGKIPKGRAGRPASTGKTLLAPVPSPGEAGVPFFHHLGLGFRGNVRGRRRPRARHVRAGRNPPCIVFIDEIDAVRPCNVGIGGGSVTNANRR